MNCLLGMLQRAFLDQDPIKTCGLACHDMQEQEQMTVPWKQRHSSYFIVQTILHVVTLVLLNTFFPWFSVVYSQLNYSAAAQMSYEVIAVHQSFTALIACSYFDLWHVWHNYFTKEISRFQPLYDRIVIKCISKCLDVMYRPCLIHLTFQLWEGSWLLPLGMSNEIINVKWERKIRLSSYTAADQWAAIEQLNAADYETEINKHFPDQHWRMNRLYQRSLWQDLPPF